MIYRFERLLRDFSLYPLFAFQNDVSIAAAAAGGGGGKIFRFCDVSLSFGSIAFFHTLMKIRIDRYNLLPRRCVFVLPHSIGFSLSSLREFNVRSMQ